VDLAREEAAVVAWIWLELMLACVDELELIE
jgi:hypothetical protein